MQHASREKTHVQVYSNSSETPKQESKDLYLLQEVSK